MPIAVLQYGGTCIGSWLQILKLQALELFATRLTVRGANTAVPKFTKEHRGIRANSPEGIMQFGVRCENCNRIDDCNLKHSM